MKTFCVFAREYSTSARAIENSERRSARLLKEIKRYITYLYQLKYINKSKSIIISCVVNYYYDDNLCGYYNIHKHMAINIIGRMHGCFF